MMNQHPRQRPDPNNIKYKGEIEHKGWDIPTVFWVLQDGTCWKNFAHGGDPYDLTTAEDLIDMAQKEGEQALAEAIAQATGHPTPEPVWMQQARAAGWTPPRTSGD